MNKKILFFQNKTKQLTTLTFGMFAFALFAGAVPAQAGYNEGSYKYPSFPKCPKPGGTLIAGYDHGEHEIVGYGRKTGADYVYKIGDGMYVQCFFPHDGKQGIQTNWIHEKHKSHYNLHDWYKIQAGSGWGLPHGTYFAKNYHFSFGSHSYGGYPVKYVSYDKNHYDDNKKHEDKKDYDHDKYKNYGQYVSSHHRQDDKKYDYDKDKHDYDRKVVYKKDYNDRDYDHKDYDYDNDHKDYDRSYDKDRNHDYEKERFVFRPVYDTKSHDYDHKDRNYDRYDHDSETKVVSHNVQLPNVSVSNVVFKYER